LISPRTKCIFGNEGEIQNIEIQNRRVITTSNKTYSYDYLVIAIGSVPQLSKVRGLSKDFNSFYTSFDDATDLGRKIESFEKGNIVVLVTSMPIPCPGAPAKFSILLSDYLKYTSITYAHCPVLVVK
jgi:sulfide:quinone oxidoreductase